MPELEKGKLRKLVRSKRDGLSKATLADAARRVAENAAQFAALQNATRVLSYVAVAGEISPETIVAQLHGATTYLPRIDDYQKHTMQFYPAENPRTRNRFNIQEPIANGSPVEGRTLDAVLLPLLLFDRSGTRVGMGGGYYDRAFAFRLKEPDSSRPLLIGLAHHFQEVASLVREPWDVPLDAIITDHELIVLC
ncbi:MAG: 5-formyltetrahydrofolate cyclo-ligase [Arenicella sp.]|nr:5-formyltetrahydrofolate cyclo-ligase [Arenicella sp.]